MVHLQSALCKNLQVVVVRLLLDVRLLCGNSGSA